MSQRRINFLKKEPFAPLKWWSGSFSDSTRVHVVADIFNEGIASGDTIVDAQMPTLRFGADLDWTTGTPNDYIVTVSIGDYGLEQDLTATTGTVTYTPHAGDYSGSQAGSINLYDSDFSYNSSIDGWATWPGGVGCDPRITTSGNYIAIGAPNFNSYLGQVSVLKWSGSVWSEIQKIDSPISSSYFGRSVKMNGAYLCVSEGTAGFIHVFKNNSDVFSFLQTLGTDPAEYLGYQTLDFDGTTVVSGYSSYGTGEGRIVIFKRSGDTFTRTYTINGGSGEGLGYLVRVNGSYLATYSNNAIGVSVFKNNGSDVWNLVEKLTVPASTYIKSGSICLPKFGGVQYLAFATYNTSNGESKIFLYRIDASSLTLIDQMSLTNTGSDYNASVYENEMVFGDEFSSEQTTQTGSIQIVQIVEGKLIKDNKLFDTLDTPQAIQRFGANAIVGSNFLVANIQYNKTNRIWVFPKSRTTYTLPSLKWDYAYYLNQQPGEVTGDQLGKGVAMYGNWSCAVSTNANSAAGGLYIYKLNTGTNQWDFIQEFVGTAGEQYAQNGSVAMYGNYIAVAATSKASDSVGQAGAIYVYKKGGGDSWSEVAVIQNSDADVSDYMGLSGLAMYGNYIAAASIQASGNYGRVWLFKNNGSDVFSRVLKVTGTGLDFACSITLEGNYLCIAARYEDSYHGQIHIYKNDGADNWTEVTTITAGTTDYYMGQKISLNGNYLATFFLANGATECVRVYKNNGSDTFNGIVDLYNPYLGSGGFGQYSIRILGSEIFIGAPGTYTQGFSGGAVFVFHAYTDNLWGNTLTVQNEDLGEPSYSEQFGFAVDAYNDQLIIGAYQDDPGDISNEGAVHFYKAPTESIVIPIIYVSLVKNQDRDLDMNDSVTITTKALFTPINTTSAPTSFTYSSLDESKATIVGSGINATISPVATGSTTVRVRTNDSLDLTGDLSVTVKDTSQTTDNWIADTRRKRFVGAYTSSQLGSTVSISGDYAIATDYTTPSDGVMIYKKSAGSWSYLTAISDPVSDHFRFAKIFGNYVVAIAYNSAYGKVFIYKNNGSDVFNEVASFEGENSSDLLGAPAGGILSSGAITMYGNYIVVGAPNYIGGTQTGRVYVYKNAGGDSWSQVATIDAPGGSSSQFGNTVSIYGDYLLVGAPGYQSGTMYVYKNDGADNFSVVNTFGYMNGAGGAPWYMQGVGQKNSTIMPGWIAVASNYGVFVYSANSDYSNLTLVLDTYGSGLTGAYYSDLGFSGDYLVVSDPSYNSYTGQFHVYKRSGLSFSKIASIRAHDRVMQSYFAESVAISDLGFDLIVGSRQADLALGKVYFYTVDPTLVTSITVSNPGADPDVNGPTASTLNAGISPGGATNDQVTWSSLDTSKLTVDIVGKLSVVGVGSATIRATANDGSGIYDDLVVPAKNSVGWNSDFTGYTLLAPLASDYYFGYGTSTDGNKIVVSLPYSGSNNYYGGVRVYKLTTSGVVLEQNLSGQDVSVPVQSYRYWGSQSCIQGDNLIVGAGTELSGSDHDVVIYKFNGSTWIEKAHFYEPTGYSPAYGCGVGISGNYAVVGDAEYNVGGYAVGRIFIYKNDGSDNWSELTTIIGPILTSSSYFGRSVCVQGDYIVIGAPGWRTLTNPAYNNGAIFIYKNDGSDNFVLKDFFYSDVADNTQFGWRVAIDGDYVAASAPYWLSSEGFVEIYKRSSSDRFEIVDKIYGDTQNVTFGLKMGMSGRYLIVGNGTSPAGAGYGNTSVWKRGFDNKYNKVADFLGSSTNPGFYHCSIGMNGSVAAIGNQAGWSVSNCRVQVFRVNIGEMMLGGSAICWCNNYVGDGQAVLSGAAEIQIEVTDYEYRMAGGIATLSGAATTSVE